MRYTKCLSTALLAAAAGQVFGQPVIDGVRDDSFYGTTPIWVQNQPTTFGDNSVTLCDPNQVGSPGLVTSGVEVAIPLSAIGSPKNPANIRIAAFVNSGGHDFLSNQSVGGMPATTNNLGEPRTVDFAAISGVQFVTGISTAATPPVINGSLDPIYGPAKFTQTVRTGFGDANTGTPGFCNGSEMDAMYAVVANGMLYILFTGNLESNFNKLELFIDSSGTVGQNTISATNPPVSNGALQRMGTNSDPNTGPVGPGLTFDTGFSADYYIAVTGGDPGTAAYTLFVDYARLSDVSSPGDPGLGAFAGQGSAQSDGTLTGGDPTAPVLFVTIDNSNIAGVPGSCPPPAGNPNVANGSEIDAVYGRIFNGKLYLLVTGNMQSNFNKMSLFFDVQAGGQNQMRGNNVDIDFNGLNRMGDDGTGNGLKWDTAFSPDYWVACTNGNASGTNVDVYSNAAVLRTDGRLVNAGGNALDYGSYDGGAKSNPAFYPVNYDGTRIDQQTGFTPNLFANYGPRTAGESLVAGYNPSNPSQSTPAVGTPGLIVLAMNNSNLAGVSGIDQCDPGATGSVAGAAQVTTGVELEITLPEVTDSCTGQCTSITSVKVGGFITSGGYDFVSNQILGGLPNTPGRSYAVSLSQNPDGCGPAFPNIDVRAIDLSQVAGDQFITISAGASCYANCDGSTTLPFLNVNDFICFQSKFAAGDTYANCDNSTTAPVLNVNDFICFQAKFAAGCSAP